MYSNNESVLNFLHNESTQTTIQKFDKANDVTYLYSGETVKKGNYRVTIDYDKFIIKPIKDSITDCVGYEKIGIGLRIIVDIKALKNNINIGSLIELVNAAEKKQVSGSIKYKIMGIESKEITHIFPINTELTASICQVYLQTIGVVRSKIYDFKTRLYPQAIAIKHSGCDINTITKKLIGLNSELEEKEVTEKLN